MKTFDQVKTGDLLWLNTKKTGRVSNIQRNNDGSVGIAYDVLRPALNKYDIQQHEEEYSSNVVRVKTDTSDEEKVFIREPKYALIPKKDLHHAASSDGLFTCKEAAITHEVTTLQYYVKCLENEIETKKQQIVKYSDRIIALLEEKESCKA